MSTTTKQTVNEWARCKWCGAEKKTRVPLCGACKVYARTAQRLEKQLQEQATEGAKAKTTWDIDAVQFPRLLAELRAIGLTHNQYNLLHEAMNLKMDEIDSVLERAESAWQVTRAAGL